MTGEHPKSDPLASNQLACGHFRGPLTPKMLCPYCELNNQEDEIGRLQSVLKIKDETIFALQTDVVRLADENRRLWKLLIHD